MGAKTFISLMLVLMVFTTGLLVLAAPARNKAQKEECPEATSCLSDAQAQAADGIMWESFSRYLLSAVQ